jgi:pantetheine-phosphate adenylyltransferase
VRIGLYAGTFDPVTNGHLDILKRSLAVFDRIIAGVAWSTPKTTLFSLEERLEMFRTAAGDLPNVGVEAFDGLLVDFARRRGAVAIIRGLRVVSDFEYEFQMALMNRDLARDLETVFLMPSAEYTYLNSTLIKAVASSGGDISRFVPDVVRDKLHEKFGKP